MSYEAWQPRTVTRRASAVGPRIARVVDPGDETVVAAPMEWRRLGAPAGRSALNGTGGATKEDGPDLALEMALLQQQCEQRVKEAHAAGSREGEAAAKASAAGEVQQVLEKLAHSIAELAQVRARLRKQAEGDTVKLSLAIAKRVLRRELAVDPDAMRGLVMAALEKLHAQEICKVRVSASQAVAITAILRQTAAHAKIEVIPDESMAPGGVVFETNQGNLDASVESQLQEIERGLADHMSKQS